MTGRTGKQESELRKSEVGAQGISEGDNALARQTLMNWSGTGPSLVRLAGTRPEDARPRLAAPDGHRWT